MPQNIFWYLAHIARGRRSLLDGQREDHQISVPRFDALVGATRDRRLIDFIAEPRGWSVIESRFVPMIELAAVAERKKELTRLENGLRRQLGGRFE